jgi:hypothetical protein
VVEARQRPGGAVAAGLVGVLLEHVNIQDHLKKIKRKFQNIRTLGF